MPDAPIRFFDSHGGLWETCACDHPDAQNFGPWMCARRVFDGPTWLEAREAGRIDDSGEWSVLTP